MFLLTKSLRVLLVIFDLFISKQTVYARFCVYFFWKLFTHNYWLEDNDLGVIIT